MLNGDGLRVVLWVAGCNHCCRECQNPITWDPDGGLLFDEAAKQEIFEQLGFRLSVVERDALEQGKETMRLLQERFDEKDGERRRGKRVMVPCRLILRGSASMKTVTESARKRRLAGKKEGK